MFELRALEIEDRDGVLAALEARDLADFAEPDVRREIPAGEWRDRAFDPADAVLAMSDGRATGYAMHDSHGGFAFLHPGYESEELRAALLGWTEARARAHHTTRYQQLMAAGDAAWARVLADSGYRPVRSLLVMELGLSQRPPAPAAPPGIAVTALNIPRDGEGIYTADTAAFADSPDYVPMNWESFCDREFADPDLDPALSRVARRGGEVVGYATCRRMSAGRGFVEILGVVEAQRRQGLGRALLFGAFAGFADAGLTHGRLIVASDNPGGLALYESAGMRPVHELVVLERPRTERDPQDQLQVGSGS